MARYSLYGFTLETDHPLVSCLLRSEAAPDLVFTCGRKTGFTTGPEEGVYESRLRPGGEPLYSLHRNERGFRLHYAGTADFHIGNDAIHCDLLDPEYAYWVEIALLGPVLSFWLENRGVVALHASAVVQGGAGVGFVAASRSGKTSLAAAFVKGGSDLLSDDILPVRLSAGGEVAAGPGYPQIRMWPDQAARFAGDPACFPLAHPDFDKRRIPARAVGGFRGTPAPLEALLLPERGEEAELSMHRLPGPEAVAALLRASFAASVLESMTEMQARRLRILAGIAKRVPVFRLRYPDGYDRLPAVREKVLDRIREDRLPSQPWMEHPHVFP